MWLVALFLFIVVACALGPAGMNVVGGIAILGGCAFLACWIVCSIVRAIQEASKKRAARKYIAVRPVRVAVSAPMYVQQPIVRRYSRVVVVRMRKHS